MPIEELWGKYLPSIKVDQQFHDNRSEDVQHTVEDRVHEGQT